MALAKRARPTRPVGLAVAGYPVRRLPVALRAARRRRHQRVLRLVPGTERPDRRPDAPARLPRQASARCYPGKAILVTETGAEANRDGPVEEKGTYAFQQDYVDYHFGVYATKPWLSGAIYWTLQEFRVRPRWEGGNPRPSPPVHQKGVIGFDGTKKPAFATCSGSSRPRQVGA